MTRHGPALRVLVTGAAGLLGAELAGRLAERGHAVIGLVHRNRRLIRNDGALLHTADYAGAAPEPGTIVLSSGDVRKAAFGLGPVETRLLAGQIDLVVHCAAATGFQPAPDRHRAINVDGAAHVAAFVREAGPAAGLVHVSTAYVSGDRSGPIAEDELDRGQGFSNDYEASKAEGEKAVLASGARLAIARPSIVVGAAGTGAIGRFENVYALLKLMGSGLVPAMPSTPGATLDLVPIDHVVDGLVDIVERFDDAAGRTFHLASDDPALIGTLVSLDYPGFHRPNLVAPETFDPTALGPRRAAIYQTFAALYAPYLQRDPRYATDNLRSLSGRSCPPTGLGFLRRIVDYAADAGYLQRGAAAGRRPVT